MVLNWNDDGVSMLVISFEWWRPTHVKRMNGGDQDGQTRHQYLKAFTIILSSPTSVTNNAAIFWACHFFVVLISGSLSATVRLIQRFLNKWLDFKISTLKIFTRWTQSDMYGILTASYRKINLCVARCTKINLNWSRIQY